MESSSRSVIYPCSFPTVALDQRFSNFSGLPSTVESDAWILDNCSFNSNNAENLISRMYEVVKGSSTFNVVNKSINYSFTFVDMPVATT
ncbi:hypothetical protein T4A_8012 [Trichinella pseudospiralis]|uniref:Uncharacterized protein n=1 Tax=Trichinella pseudospiralis TaxID=6337 RepID=A0A0V1EXZ2_TRIPS|nr:hypothetical protein T4A_8012 [Trichinella pseudospiralis]